MRSVLESFRDLLAARCVEPEGEHLPEMLHVGFQELIGSHNDLGLACIVVGQIIEFLDGERNSIAEPMDKK
jgi:hypothetical protein